MSKTTLPATGRQDAVLTVSKFGRYAVTVASPQGTALQLIDRLAGPGEIQGVAGKTDGRVDAFLDRGAYKIVAHSHEKGSGDAKLAVHTFTERNTPQPPLLIELKPIDGTLNDFEQASYWLEVKQRRRVVLEAAGRNLADLRLWSNGDWLVDVEPSREVVTPQEAHPLLVCRLTADLNPGLYLLTAYGGVSQPWAEDSSEHPFHLRFGIPKLGAVGRHRYAVSPFGVDRWLVPGSATYFRVELPEAHPASLDVARYDAASPFQTGGEGAAINKNSLVPVAELEVGSRTSDHIVTVTGIAGQPYVLQHFNRGTPFWCGGRYWQFGEDGNYWVSTVHSGDPSDSIDATAIVTRVPRWKPEGPHREPFLSAVVELGAADTWARRCNLLEPLTVFLHIQQTGKYRILARGPEARFRIEPFFTSKPDKYEPPDMQPAGSIWDLDAGYYVLTAEPVKLGIVDLALVPGDQSTAPDVLNQLIGKNRDAELTSLRAAAQFPLVSLSRDYLYDIYLNAQPEVKVGMVLRRLPLDLTEPLPVIQQPGERIAVPFRADEPGTLHADVEDGSLLDVSVDGGAPHRSQTVKKGEHTLEVAYAGAGPVHYALLIEPQRLQTNAPLPPLPDPQRATPPQLPVLTDKAPSFLDLDRNASATFLVRADKPALYRLQSTGLLATQGNLRTRTITSFDRATANGVGRNFFIQQYLREGDYQITVAAQGMSKGHLGLTLDRTPLIDGGTLSASAPLRVTLAAGQAVAYRFTVAEAGDYRLRSIGVGTTFRCRLEDADGWPIERPNIPADLTRHFEPGTYQIVSLPEPVAARRLTLLERIPQPQKRTGHGPHALSLAQRVSHVWLEPEAGGERTPDAWEFTLPAPVDARIELTGEMQGDLALITPDATMARVAHLPPGRGWKGKLEGGRYRLDATCVRPNNRARYEVGVWPEQLVAGLDRAVPVPASIPVSVGRDGLVQLNSFGSSDVRARLYDAHGRLVASNDDGPDDWNFQIQTRISAGSYRLQVDPVGGAPAKMLAPPPTPTPQPEYDEEYGEGSSTPPTPAPLSAACSVSMRAPEEALHEPVALPAKLDLELDQSVAVYPLSFGGYFDMILVGARSPEGVGCAIEARTEDGTNWRQIASAVGRVINVETLKPSLSNEFRLRVWTLDGRPTKVHLTAATFAGPELITQYLNEQQLARGVRLIPVYGVDPPVGAAAVQLFGSGLFKLRGEAGHIRSCDRVGGMCAAPPYDLASGTGTYLFLAANLPSATVQPTVAATRIVLKPGTDQAVQFRVDAGETAAVDVRSTERGPLLAVATSMTGQPAVRLRNPSSGRSPEYQTMAVGPHSAAAVALHAEPMAAVWSADPTPEPLDVRLRSLSFPAPNSTSLGWGAFDTALSGVTATAFDLPEGWKRLHLTLRAATVAALSARGSIESVHWLGDEPFEEDVYTSANLLTVLHTRDASDRFALEVSPLAAGETAPSLRTPYEHASLSAGVSRLRVDDSGEPDRPFTVHVRGAKGDAVLISERLVLRGTDLRTTDGGTLLVPHGPGLVLAWIDRPGEEAPALWGDATLPPAANVTAPASVALTGTAQLLHLDVAAPTMLHLRTSTALVTWLKRGDGPPEVEVHANGALLDAYVTPGPVQLGMRAIAGRTLTGSAEITASPVAPIGEGLGAEVLLAAGATRLFSFTVTRDGPVGIGVRSTPDVVDCTLLDSGGKRLGMGVVQMPTLTPGTYLLALHAPPDVGPVLARPALAGIELPSTGPPEEIVRAYMTGAMHTPTPATAADNGEDE